MREIKLEPYHVDIINSIPRYSSATPKRDMRKIKEIMREQEYDDAYTQNISQDFCEGWNTARGIIESMLSDRYWRLKRQMPERR